MVLILGHLEFPIGGLIDTQDELPLVGEVLPRLLTLLVDRVQGADDDVILSISLDTFHTSGTRSMLLSCELYNSVPVLPRVGALRWQSRCVCFSNSS